MEYDIDEMFMRFAIEKAHEGIKKGQTPFGACIVKDGKALAITHNTVWKNMDITAHAEINAIREACRKLGSISLPGCTIYTTCEPCSMCFSACRWARIKRIVYGATIEDSKKFGFNEIMHTNRVIAGFEENSTEIIDNFMREECLNLFKIWNGRKDKRPY